MHFCFPMTGLCHKFEHGSTLKSYLYIVGGISQKSQSSSTLPQKTEKMEATSYAFPELPKLPSRTINDQQTSLKGRFKTQFMANFEWQTYITGNKEACNR